MDLNKIYQPLQPIHPQGDEKRGDKGKKPAAGEDFAAILDRVQGELKFSRHAQQRLQTRSITLTPGVVDRLQAAVEKAADKGARESLVLMDEMAFVVSVKNRMVITAMTGDSIKEHVFTNIDSAVIAK